MNRAPSNQLPRMASIIVKMILLYVCIETSAGSICGYPSLKPYDPVKQDCENGIIVDKEEIYCGVPPIKISLRTHKCQNGTAVPMNPTPTRRPKTKPSPSPPPTLLPPSTPLLSSTSDDRPRRNICPSDNVPDGYACCQQKLYRPKEETCCTITRSYYEVLNGPEMEHVCCTNASTMTPKLYKRGSTTIPCQHPSSNNKLFGKGESLKKAGSNMCDTFLYVFKLAINKQILPANNSHLDINIKGWTRTASIGRRRSKWTRIITDSTNDVRAELDKYIPKRSNYIPRTDLPLGKKCFMVFTNKNYYEDGVFYLNHDEVLFKCPRKRKSVKKILKKNNKKCLTA